MSRQTYGWVSDLAAKLGQANVMALCLLHAFGICLAVYYDRDLRWVFAVNASTSMTLVLDRLIGCFGARRENADAYADGLDACRPKDSSKNRHHEDSKNALASATRSVRK